MDIPVECPRCNNECETTLDAVDSRSPIKCSCGNTFAIGDVFERLYDEERLVKDSVDIVTKYAISQRELKVSDSSRDATEQFLKLVRFEDLMRDIAKQVLVHGDAFLKIIKKGGATSWESIPPAHVVIKTSWAREGGSKASFLREDKFVYAGEKDSTVFTPDEVVHFKRSLLPYGNTPYGVSMIEICLRHIHYLRQYKRHPPPADSGFDKWKDYLEEQIIMGLGVPKFVLDKNPNGFAPRIAEFILTVFMGEIRDTSNILSDGFNMGLERFARQSGLKDVPTIEFAKLNARRILIDSGFDFTEEARKLRGALEGLYRSGIINKEYYDKMLREYSP
jgi:hypothetical protein